MNWNEAIQKIWGRPEAKKTVSVPTEPSAPADSSCAPVTGSESLTSHRRCDDREHHWATDVDRVVVDIYDSGEVIVLIAKGEKVVVIDCGGGSPNAELCEPPREGNDVR